MYVFFFHRIQHNRHESLFTTIRWVSRGKTDDMASELLLISLANAINHARALESDWRKLSAFTKMIISSHIFLRTPNCHIKHFTILKQEEADEFDQWPLSRIIGARCSAKMSNGKHEHHVFSSCLFLLSIHYSDSDDLFSELDLDFSLVALTYAALLLLEGAVFSSLHSRLLWFIAVIRVVYLNFYYQQKQTQKQQRRQFCLVNRTQTPIWRNKYQNKS